MTSNFKFLNDEWREIREAAAQAESLTFKNPRTACFHARRSLELALEWLYDHDSRLEIPIERNLNGMLSEPSFRALVPTNIYHGVLTIKDLGNHAAHSERHIKDNDSYKAVFDLFDFLCWFQQEYGEHLTDSNKPGAFLLSSNKEHVPFLPAFKRILSNNKLPIIFFLCVLAAAIIFFFQTPKKEDFLLKAKTVEVNDSSHQTVIVSDVLIPKHWYSLMISSNGVFWKSYTNFAGGATTVKVSVLVNPAWTNLIYRFVDITEDEWPPSPPLVWISPGSFTMGSFPSELAHAENEVETTHVTLTHGFWISQYEITQPEYTSLIKTNIFQFHGQPALPAESVSWAEATNYCYLLTLRERRNGRLPLGFVYRLPTEAEWEYVCRAGTQTRFFYGDDVNYQKVKQYAWNWANSGKKQRFFEQEPWFYDSNCHTHTVGTRMPNPWGVYDIIGNVWEWCSDWIDDHPGGPVTNPVGPLKGALKVIRGGCWGSGEVDCRSAARLGINPSPGASFRVGFRIVLAPEFSKATVAQD